MQTATEIFQTYGHTHSSNAQTANKTNQGLMAKLFGCRHSQMSRPFSVNGQSYRSCVDCGARRAFDIESWEMQGDYYYGLPNVFAGHKAA